MNNQSVSCSLLFGGRLSLLKRFLIAAFCFQWMSEKDQTNVWLTDCTQERNIKENYKIKQRKKKRRRKKEWQDDWTKHERPNKRIKDRIRTNGVYFLQPGLTLFRRLIRKIGIVWFSTNDIVSSGIHDIYCLLFFIYPVLICFINWVDDINWPPYRVFKLTSRALALRLPFVIPSSSLRHPFVSPSAAFRQPFVSPSSSLRQPFVITSSSLRHPFVRPSSALCQSFVSPSTTI